jgi:hypothetical protein
MSSPAASAMYPALAKAEAKAEKPVQQQGSGGRPSWARSSNPVWDVEPARAAPGYAVVPGLTKIGRK